jgi:predicted metalloprotease
VWAASVYARGVLEPGDVNEGLAAAAAVGDDRIQEQTQGRIDPESFTHGTSEQRATWFRIGFESGDPDACDTFDADI